MCEFADSIQEINIFFFQIANKDMWMEEHMTEL